jgi:UDP-glucuronate 4-epimerase
MALFTFTQAILEGRPIDVFNFGDMQRDFTYIDDIVEGVLRILAKPASPNLPWSSEAPDPASSSSPYQIYNIGNHRPVAIEYLIDLLEQALGQTVQRNLLPMQPGDVRATYADVDDLIRDVGFKPDTPIEVGIRHFVKWYREYYQHA